MYLEFWNPKKLIQERDEMITDEIIGVQITIMGFPIVHIGLYKDGDFCSFIILGFGFVFDWE